MRVRKLKKDVGLSEKLVCRFCGSSDIVGLERFIRKRGKQKFYCNSCKKEGFPAQKKEKRKRKKIDWHAYNQKLIDRGKIIIYVEKEDWKGNLTRINIGKVGRPYEYPTLLIHTAVGLRFCMGQRYRQEEGFLGQMVRYGVIPKSPSYTQLCRRVNEHIGDAKSQLEERMLEKWNKGGILAVDSTGVKVYDRGEWMRQKHGVRRGWYKLHVAVDENGNPILADVTEEDMADSEVFEEKFSPKLGALQPREVDADGGYDTNNIFDAIGNAGAKPVIPPNDGAIIGCTSKIRGRVVEEMIDIGYKEWAKKHGYGKRWIVEGYFSVFKGIFGEYVMSRKKENGYNELYAKMLILEELKDA